MYAPKQEEGNSKSEREGNNVMDMRESSKTMDRCCHDSLFIDRRHGIHHSHFRGRRILFKDACFPY